MLSTRLLSSFVGLLLLFGTLYLGGFYLYIAMWIISSVGVYELYKAFGQKNIHPFYGIGLFCNFLLFFMIDGGGWDAFFLPDYKNQVTEFLFLLSFSLMLIILLYRHEERNVLDIGSTLFGIIYAGYLFTFLPKTLFLKDGNLLIFIIFIGAWVTDSGAYFTGKYLGKRKLVPRISPKKTVAGGIGGILTVVIIMSGYGACLLHFGKISVPVYHFILLGFICGVVSQVGDWIASVIKRFTGVKDYGKIMPGHGGVLDRFDSILFMAPFVYYYIVLVVQR